MWISFSIVIGLIGLISDIIEDMDSLTYKF